MLNWWIYTRIPTLWRTTRNRFFLNFLFNFHIRGSFFHSTEINTKTKFYETTRTIQHKNSPKKKPSRQNNLLFLQVLSHDAASLLRSSIDSSLAVFALIKFGFEFSSCSVDTSMFWCLIIQNWSLILYESLI